MSYLILGGDTLFLQSHVLYIAETEIPGGECLVAELVKLALIGHQKSLETLSRSVSKVVGECTRDNGRDL